MALSGVVFFLHSTKASLSIFFHSRLQTDHWIYLCGLNKNQQMLMLASCNKSKIAITFETVQCKWEGYKRQKKINIVSKQL